MAKKPLPTIAMLHKLLRYEPETGLLFWRERTPDMFSDRGNGADVNCRTWNASNSGKEAFRHDLSGYLCGTIFRKTHRSHRVIYAMHYGEWPSDQIDHINHDKQDNRIGNLRDVSQTENQRNRMRNKNNTSGFNGVYIAGPNMWYAAIQVDGANIHLGKFSTIDMAIDARKEANREYGFSQTHGEKV